MLEVVFGMEGVDLLVRQAGELFSLEPHTTIPVPLSVFANHEFANSSPCLLKMAPRYHADMYKVAGKVLIRH